MLYQLKETRENFLNEHQLRIDNQIEIQAELDEEIIDSSREQDIEPVQESSRDFKVNKKADQEFQNSNGQGFSNIVWKKRAYLIIYYVTKFIVTVLQSSDKFKFSFVDRNIIDKINDSTADYDFYMHRGYIRQKLNPSFQTKFQNLLEQSELFRKIRHITDGSLKAIKVFKPTSTFKVIWDAIVFVILMLNIVYIPLKVAFELAYVEPQDTFLIMDLLPTIIYIVDILIIFNTGFYSHGQLVLERKLIAQHYFRTHFIQDLISLLPIILRFNIDYLELIQLVRINRILNIMESLEERFNLRIRFAAIIDVTKIIFSFLFICHLIACAWHLVAVFETNANIHDTWRDQNDIINRSWQSRYITSLYWSIVTTLTIGYGDIIPITDVEKLFVICIGLISSVTFGYTVSSLGNIFSQISEQKTSNRNKISLINSFLIQRGIEKELQVKIQKFFEYYLFKINQENDKERTDLFKNLSLNLQNELKIDMYKKYLSKSKLFQTFSQELIDSLCQIMHEKSMVPDENIFVKGQIVDQLIFLVKGHVEIFVDRVSEDSKATGKKIKTHEKSSYFFQMEPKFLRQVKSGQSIDDQQFLVHGQSRFNAKASSYIKVAYIAFAEFEELMKTFPEDWQKYQQIKNQINMKEQSFLEGCEFCKKKHDYLQCPFMFYCPNIPKVIRQQAKLVQIRKQQRRSFLRTKQSLSNAQLNQESAILFQIKENLVQEFDINSDYLKKFGNFGRQISDVDKISSKVKLLTKINIPFDDQDSTFRRQKLPLKVNMEPIKGHSFSTQNEIQATFMQKVNNSEQQSETNSLRMYEDKQVQNKTQDLMITLKNEYLNVYSQNCIFDIDKEQGFQNYYPKNNFSKIVGSLNKNSTSMVMKNSRLGKLFTPKHKRIRTIYSHSKQHQLRPPLSGDIQI